MTPMKLPCFICLLLYLVSAAHAAPPPPNLMPIRGNVWTTNVPPVRLTNAQELLQTGILTVDVPGAATNDWGHAGITQLIRGSVLMPSMAGTNASLAGFDTNGYLGKASASFSDGTNTTVVQLGPFVPLRIPVANGTNTLTDGPLSIPSAGSTNVIVDGQIFFVAETNVLRRVNGNLVWTNSATTINGVNFQVQNGNGISALFGIDQDQMGYVRAPSGRFFRVEPDAGSQIFNFTASALFPSLAGNPTLGAAINANSVWGGLETSGNARIYGFYSDTAGNGNYTNYSRLNVSHTGTNGAVVVNSQSAGTAGEARDFLFQSNSVTVAKIAANSGYTGTGVNFLSDDGLYRLPVGGGTNTPVVQLGPFTPLRIPVADGTNTLTDGPLSIPSAGSTNVILDGQIHFHSGNAVSNSLTRVGDSLVYTNNSLSGTAGPGFIAMDSLGRQAALLVNGTTAEIQGSGSIDLNTGTVQARLSNVSFSPLTDGLNLGTLNGSGIYPWTDIVGRGTIYNIGFPLTGNPGGSDYSRLAITHTGTNGFIILDSQALGSAGNPRPLRFNFGGTNYFEFTYDNGAIPLPRFVVKDAPGTSYIRMQLTGGVVPTIDGSTSIAFADDVVTKNIATDTDNTYDIGSTANNGAYRDTYFKGSQHAVGANDGVGNYTWLAIRHTGNSGAIEFASEAGGTGVVRPISFTNAPVILHGFTKVQKAALTPVEGMLVFQTDNTPGLRVYQSGAWVMVSTVADP